jgi:hypothetical protein
LVSSADPLRSLISVFYTGAAIFLSSGSSFILTRAEWTAFQTHRYSENLVGPGIEPGTSELVAMKSSKLFSILDHDRATKLLGTIFKIYRLGPVLKPSH